MSAYEPIKLDVSPEDASATRGDGSFELSIRLSRSPSEVWRTAFHHYEREVTHHYDQNVAKYVEPNLLLVTTDLRHLPHRWKELQAAARHANEEARIAAETETAQANREQQRQLEFRRQLAEVLEQLPRGE